MQTIERVNNSFVRHEWKAIADGVAEGRSFLVENHGKPEALIVSPRQMNLPAAPEGDLDAHFDRLLAQKPMPESFFVMPRSPEV